MNINERDTILYKALLQSLHGFDVPNYTISNFSKMLEYINDIYIYIGTKTSKYNTAGMPHNINTDT